MGSNFTENMVEYPQGYKGLIAHIRSLKTGQYSILLNVTKEKGLRFSIAKFQRVEE